MDKNHFGLTDQQVVKDNTSLLFFSSVFFRMEFFQVPISAEDRLHELS